MTGHSEMASLATGVAGRIDVALDYSEKLFVVNARSVAANPDMPRRPRC
jgi:hypothetical protein